MKNTVCKIFLLLLVLTTAYSAQVRAYSVLSHEAIIDVCWDQSLVPILKDKFPGITDDQLKEAHAYAYGGCLVPDMGYYPFGSKLFTNLVHYVRSGDFVTALFLESRDINQFAFSLGVLCHYYSDKYGHPMGTNRSVPLLYPKDKEQFGSYVTYEQDPVTHVRVEFGFDVVQTARGNYASENYHSFIGFKIDTAVLDRAFTKTYGLSLGDVFKNFPLAVSTFRWVVHSFFPVLTRTAWATKKKDIRKANPTITRRKFEYRMRRANYYHEFGRERERPGFFPSVLAGVIKVVPKVGKLKELKILVPGPEAEKLFIQSFDTAANRYNIAVRRIKADRYQFLNIDWDTGNDTYPGEYDLADESYGDLLLKIKEKNFKNVDAALKHNVLTFYGSCNEKIAAQAGKDKWHDITIALEQLKEYQASK